MKIVHLNIFLLFFIFLFKILGIRYLYYNRLILIININRDYYEEDDPSRLQKSLVSSDIRIIENIPTAMKFVMYNKNDNTQTEMELLEVKYNIQLQDDLFSERSLKK